MGWSNEDGSHEGWVAEVIPDGRLSHGSAAGVVLVDGITGNYPVDDVVPDWERVPSVEVVAWRGTCGCGWKGQQWPRPAEQDPFYPPAEVEDAVYREWQIHIAPVEAAAAVAAAAAAHAATAVRLDAAVDDARRAGATWADIGRAAGISRQSAHERWGKSRASEPLGA